MKAGGNERRREKTNLTSLFLNSIGVSPVALERVVRRVRPTAVVPSGRGAGESEARGEEAVKKFS